MERFYLVAVKCRERPEQKMPTHTQHAAFKLSVLLDWVEKLGRMRWEDGRRLSWQEIVMNDLSVDTNALEG